MIKTLEEITSFQLDWLFIIGWSQIANQEVLEHLNFEF